MHTLQKLLITRLVKENGISYSILTKGYDSEDNIAFHVKQLLSKDLIEKREDKYFITIDGLNTLSTFQKSDLQDNSFKMFFVGIVCKCEDSFLIKPHTNVKKFFYNLPSGSPLFGEKLEEALPRILYEETNVRIEPEMFKFDSLHMKTVKTGEGKVIFDDAFGVYTVEVDAKQKDKMVLNKGRVWMSKSAIEELENKWPEIDFCVLRENWEPCKVYKVVCDYVLK